MFALEPVDESFLGAAQYRFVYPIDLPVPPQQVWEGLVSSRPLEWCRLLTWVEYSSETPFGVGTTRSSRVAWGAMSFRERFFRWDDEQHRHSFYVEECNVPLTSAFAEDYNLTPTEGGCRFTGLSLSKRTRDTRLR